MKIKFLITPFLTFLLVFSTFSCNSRNSSAKLDNCDEKTQQITTNNITDSKSIFQQNKDSSKQAHNVALENSKDVNIKDNSSKISQTYPDFTKAAEISVNGVVHVKVVKKTMVSKYINPLDFFFGFDNSDIRQIPREKKGFGSGVIISNDGYIITNNHVIDGATNISITLNDGREFNAKIVGSDSNSDVALLKIEGNNFPYLTIGNSDELRVGQWVLAVGNPLNLTSTVTAGIVSAKNRSNVMIGDSSEKIKSFIQIDAAVNPGNSGGALVNIKGELVGINTAIYSETGSFSGYAFAIPISIVIKIAADLKKYGNVQRAILGIMYYSPDVISNIAELAERSRDPKEVKKAQEILKEARDLLKIKGVKIQDFPQRSASKEAGLKKGDIIIKINQTQINNYIELQETMTLYRPGDKIKVLVNRDGKEKYFSVELKNNEGGFDILKENDIIKSIGASFSIISDIKKEKLGINIGIEVNWLDNKGVFYKNGIRKGFIIMKINNNIVNTKEDIAEIIKKINNQKEDKVLLLYGFYPNSKNQYIVIDLN